MSQDYTATVLPLFSEVTILRVSKATSRLSPLLLTSKVKLGVGLSFILMSKDVMKNGRTLVRMSKDSGFGVLPQFVA